MTVNVTNLGCSDDVITLADTEVLLDSTGPTIALSSTVVFGSAVSKNISLFFTGATLINVLLTIRETV